MIELSEEQRARYLEEGFAALPRLADDAELDWLGGVYDKLFAERFHVEDGDYFDIAGRREEDSDRLPQIIRPEKYVPELLATRHFQNCQAVASRLLDCPAADLSHYGHMIMKAAGSAQETPWHQDEAYMDPRWHRRGLSIWMPLDAAPVDGGCLHFVPRSHREPVLAHRHIDHDSRVRGLMTDLADTSKAVSVPLGRGEASVHDMRTLHYSGPNASDRTRRAFVVVFTTPAVEVEAEPRPWLID